MEPPSSSLPRRTTGKVGIETAAGLGTGGGRSRPPTTSGVAGPGVGRRSRQPTRQQPSQARLGLEPPQPSRGKFQWRVARLEARNYPTTGERGNPGRKALLPNTFGTTRRAATRRRTPGERARGRNSRSAWSTARMENLGERAEPPAAAEAEPNDDPQEDEDSA